MNGVWLLAEMLLVGGRGAKFGVRNMLYQGVERLQVYRDADRSKGGMRKVLGERFVRRSG